MPRFVKLEQKVYNYKLNLNFFEITMKKKVLTSMLLLGVAGSVFAANTNTKPIMHLKELQKQNKKVASNEAKFIRNGMGWSNDSEMLSDDICYAVASTDESAGDSRVLLSEAFSYKDLLRELKIDVNLNIGIGLFGGGFSLNYLKSMKDTDLSYSLNYLNYSTKSISINFDKTNEYRGLTETGNADYMDGDNEYFGLMCGDEVITAYQKGALLTFGLKLHFHNHSDLETFRTKVSAGWGTIFSASTEVQKIARENNIQGTVTLQAYQMGGEPEKLSTILGKDESGDYYALSCDMQNMDKCKDTANAMLAYAESGFPNQYTLAPKDDDKLQSFGIGFASTKPLRMAFPWYHTPESFVTPEVEQARKDLDQDIKENKYYQEHLDAIVNHYPVELDGQYKDTLQKLLDKADYNLDILTNSRKGAISCYLYPDTCVQDAKKLEDSLKPITDEEINNTLEPIKYSLYLNDKHDTNVWINFETTPHEYFTNSIDLLNYAAYGYGIFKDKKFNISLGNNIKLPNIKSTSIIYDYGLVGVDQYRTGRGTLNGSYPLFSGTTTTDNENPGWNKHISIKLQNSTYYFTPYESDETQIK